MRSVIIRIAVFCISFLLISEQMTVSAQENDAALWTGIQLEKGIGIKSSLSIEQGYRRYENLTRLDKIFSEIGYTYRINKYFRAGLYYRFVREQKLDFNFSTRHRLVAEFSSYYKKKKWRFSSRIRYQRKYIDVYSSSEGSIPLNQMRYKFSVRRKIKGIPVRVTGGLEIFQKINKNEKKEIEKLRYILKLQYKIDKTNTAELFYLIQPEVNQNNPVTSYIIGISYSISL